MSREARTHQSCPQFGRLADAIAELGCASCVSPVDIASESIDLAVANLEALREALRRNEEDDE